MKVRPSCLAILASLGYGGLGVFPVLQAAEPEAVTTPAAPSPVEHATAEAKPAAVGAPVAATTEPPSNTTAVQPPVVAGADVPAATTARPPTNDDDEIVCKQIEVFGSRVRKGKLCRTKKEWQTESQSAKDFSKAIQKGSASQPRDLDGS